MVKVTTMRRLASSLIYPAIGISILGSVIVLFVVHAYRINKIDVLTDRSLQPVLDKAEDADAPVTVYLVGDSQIAHWPLDCRKNWSLYRSGFPGQSTVNIASATSSLFRDVRPDVVFIIAGGNDLSAASLLPENLQNSAITHSVSSYQKLIESSVGSGARQTFISYVETTRYKHPVRWLLGASNIDRLRDQLNSALGQICQNQCQLVSLKTMLGVRSNAEWRTYLADKVHLNRRAYRVLAQSLDSMILM